MAPTVVEVTLSVVAGLNALVKQYLDLIQQKGMLEAVKTIL